MHALASIKADEKFMQAALAEARQGLGLTSPNPAVGAVIVRAGRIIARGWHRAAGQPHAEIEAIRALQNKSARGATIYVTLEPCSTHGRTPPCTSAILESGLARVVYGATDPNRQHAGRAEKILTKAGLKVTTGILAEECTALNTAWNKWIVTGLPYVIAKAGMTLDGKIASPPEQRWITSPASRKDAMKLRASVDAIMVGGQTVRVDNPTLTVRGIKVKQQPWRVVWSRSGRLPRQSILLTDEHRARTIVLKALSLRAALKDLGQRGIQSVLIEGGSHLLGEAFDRQLVDEVCFYLAPLLTGGSVPAVGGKGAPAVAFAQRLERAEFMRIGGDVRLRGRIERNATNPL